MWGGLAGLRGKLLDAARPRGGAAVDELRIELDALGPIGLWRETVRYYLREHGFAPSGNESFFEVLARALGISMPEFKTLLTQNRIGSALKERFTAPRAAGDDTQGSKLDGNRGGRES